MAFQKTLEEIELMKAGGALLSRSLQAAIDAARAGVKLIELDRIAEQAIRDGGGTPSFLGYTAGSDTPFPSTLCISVNDEVVHGLGNRERALKDGDLVGLDIGCWYKGLCTDMAVTIPIGGFKKAPKEVKNLLMVTRESMMAGIEAARVGGTVKDISTAIEGAIKPHNYGIVRALVGHGVGHKVHEDPHVPNYVSDKFPRVEILNRMCLAIEPMVTLGGWKVTTADDGWAVMTEDGSLAAHFELTIAIKKDGIEFLTPPPNVGF